MTSRRTIRSTASLIAMTGASASLLAAPVAADHGDNSSSLSRERDNNQQEVDATNLSEAGELACKHGASELDRTEIEMSNGDSDLHCIDANYGHDVWVGLTNCDKAAYLYTRCDQYITRFNYNVSGPNPSEAEKPLWKSTGCHEFGHTSSVGHRSAASDTDENSCMRNDSYFPTQFDSHDFSSIGGDN